MTDEAPAEPLRAAKGVADAVKDVLDSHAPKAAEHGARATAAGRKAFLEELEGYNAEMLGPLIDKLRASGNMPPEIDKMLDAIKEPTAQIGGILSSFFLYGVMFQLAGNVLQPFFQEVSNDVWSAHRVKPLSPADLATGAVRGIVPGDPAITNYLPLINDIAGESGISAEDMQYLADISGQPPSPQDLLEMKRRGIITMAQVEQGLKEGDTRDEWISSFVQLDQPVDHADGLRRRRRKRADTEDGRRAMGARGRPGHRLRRLRPRRDRSSPAASPAGPGQSRCSICSST